VSNQPNGRRAVQFIAGDGRRRSIRLGKVSREAAESVKLRVEQLLTCRITGHAMSRDLALWVRDLDDVLHGKLAAVGLVEPRNTYRLGEAVASFMATKAGLKHWTLSAYRRVQIDLLAYFGEGLDVRSITAGQADAWHTWLREDRGLARATVGKYIRTVRAIMEQLRRDNVIERNPFDHLSGSMPSNPKRRAFIEQADIRRVLDVCPDAEWRLIVALARFGGLRVPSELERLRWADVLWDRNRFIVRASKTEHHADGGMRQVPIFPELLPYLRESFELAEPGAEYVIPTRRRSANLRTQLLRLVERAGLTPWPKLFQNLRASRETELLAWFPIHVVTAWLGNSPQVALNHYATVRESDYDKAVQKAVHNPVQSGGEVGYTVLDGVEVGFPESLEKQGKTSHIYLEPVQSGIGSMPPQGLEP